VSGLTDAVAVTAGGDSTCALRVNGALRCWGKDNAGQLGNDATLANRTAPADVLGISDAVAVTQSGLQACAVKVTGSVRCWGGNKEGALGNNTTVSSPTSVGVVGVTDAIAVSAGRTSSAWSA
jgi:alpha-tubulin suppressor-like RCC1 family protein